MARPLSRTSRCAWPWCDEPDGGRMTDEMARRINADYGCRRRGGELLRDPYCCGDHGRQHSREKPKFLLVEVLDWLGAINLACCHAGHYDLASLAKDVRTKLFLYPGLDRIDLADSISPRGPRGARRRREYADLPYGTRVRATIARLLRSMEA